MGLNNFSGRVMHICQLLGKIFWRDKVKASFMMVIDLLANKDLAQSVITDGKVISGMASAEYQKKSEELLATCVE